MYLRITRGRFDPAKYDQLLPLADEVTASTASTRWWTAWLGPSSPSAPSTTEAHARFAREETLGEVIGRIRALGVQLEPPEVYEVTSHN
jgi:hypothetical protein